MFGHPIFQRLPTWWFGWNRRVVRYLHNIPELVSPHSHNIPLHPTLSNNNVGISFDIIVGLGGPFLMILWKRTPTWWFHPNRRVGSWQNLEPPNMMLLCPTLFLWPILDPSWTSDQVARLREVHQSQVHGRLSDGVSLATNPGEWPAVGKAEKKYPPKGIDLHSPCKGVDGRGSTGFKLLASHGYENSNLFMPYYLITCPST